MTLIRFRRGNKADLPESAPSGMPLWCEDSQELYLGTNNGVTPLFIDKPQLSEGFIPYCVNSGNTDSNGYPDLIQKVSDTEVAFKVGGSFPNIGVTFPNGKHYIISEIPNITGFSTDGIYSFVLMEDNLIKLENGTYSATLNPIKLGYTFYENLVPVMQSSSQDGFSVQAINPNNSSAFSNPHLLFDRNTSTGISFPWGWGNGIYATLDYITPIKITKCQFYAPTSSGSLGGIVHIVARGSNDNINWNEILNTGDMRSTGNINSSPTFECHSPGYYKHYVFQVISVNLVGGHSSTTSNWRMIKPFYDQEFGGGNITEDFVMPQTPENGDLHLLINQKPLKPYIKQASGFIEKQFVKIGEIQKLSNLLGTPTTYAFNGLYSSGWSTLTNNANFDRVANLGVDGIFQHIEVYARQNENYQPMRITSIDMAESWNNYGADSGVRNKNTIRIRTANNSVLPIRAPEWGASSSGNKTSAQFFVTARRKF